MSNTNHELGQGEEVQNLVASVEPEPDTTGPDNPERDDQDVPEPS